MGLEGHKEGWDEKRQKNKKKRGVRKSKRWRREKKILGTIRKGGEGKGKEDGGDKEIRELEERKLKVGRRSRRRSNRVREKEEDGAK